MVGHRQAPSGGARRWRRPALLVATLPVLSLIGCVQPGPGLDTSPATRSRSAWPGQATSGGTGGGSPALTPPASATPGQQAWASVSVVAAAGDPAVRAVTRYLPAWAQVMGTADTKLPAYRATTTPAWQRDQATRLAQAEARGLTLARGVHWAVVGVRRVAGQTRVRACSWGPSEQWIATGAPATPATPLPTTTALPTTTTGTAAGSGWSALDVRMRLLRGTWRVDHIYTAEFSCRPAR